MDDPTPLLEEVIHVLAGATPSIDLVDESYSAYVEAVEQGLVGFYQILRDVFVVQGWDRKKRELTNGWYHLQQAEAAGGVVFGCCCPDPAPQCIHQIYLEDGGLEQFSGEDMPTDETLLVHLSVATPGRQDVKSRAIVAHQGLRADSGSWRCHRDQGVEFCVHVSQVLKQKLLLELIHGEGTFDESNLSIPTPISQLQTVAISHCAVLPPEWAALPSDPPLSRPSVLKEPPTTLLLDSSSSCPCNGTRTWHDPEHATTLADGVLYTLTSGHRLQVQLQRCPNSSPRQNRFIGPDPHSLGIFNFNNHAFFTHDLLDEYTSEFTSSETPFTAWVAVSTRRYQRHNSKERFVSEGLFRSAWFAYIELQIFDNDMRCPSCGPCPAETIWDGVTLAFSRKHLLSSLQPPTTLMDTSPIHGSRPVKGPQLLPDAKFRKSTREVVKSSLLGSIQKILGTESIPSNAEELEDLIEQIPVAGAYLLQVNEPLGGLFIQHFGVEVLACKSPNSLYVRLFEQIAAEESVLQFANGTALNNLRQFLAAPDTNTIHFLHTIPALYQVARYHVDHKEPLPPPLIAVCQWIHTRGTKVLNKLLANSPASTEPSSILDEPDWKTSGCCYSLPKLRQRPKFPHLKHDQTQEPGGDRGGKCSKFYAQYGKKRLTGGIMCVWCTHSICYGFHFIPANEGRNDVFSALYTRWPRPPKLVVYDFACALGPYCMTREPSFFSETVFGIDGFHAKGHTKCSPAAFLSNHVNVDPRLMRINSSAAECGNSGINRIRKVVSYMTQQRAIVYTRVFIAMWNRLRIRQILASKA
ncbi:hypothetical protein BDN72DRAFT_870445 [Pluteus cervinus]|uniref:Uncharacterized protein n=1 Tax=Pluteus cervinus TaxID=181527 RepID=A0ACD3AXX0_9AGAR|nr:hypothetical protein BDN72DRAFT_870445 [Pluteus cervinus]